MTDNTANNNLKKDQTPNENKTIEESTNGEQTKKSIDIKEILNKVSKYIKEWKYFL